MHLPAAAALPRLCSAGFSIVSFNVLLPNSQDGWWLYKYYDNDTPLSTTLWPARASLLAERLLTADADIVMLQECSAESFETDWSFLTDAGYASAMHSKGRMRPATFWKKDRMELCDISGEPLDADAGTDAGLIHADRTLTTMLRPKGEDGLPLPSRGPLYVVNCHLTAGPEARRRLRQAHEALDNIRKARVKAKLPIDGKAPIACVVGGDFNSQGQSGVRQLLEAGEVLPAFRESGDPTEVDQPNNEVTSKAKKQLVGAFTDVMALAYGGGGRGAAGAPQPTATDGGDTEEIVARFDAWRRIREADASGGATSAVDGGDGGDGADAAAEPPPTIIAPELMSHMVDAEGQVTPALTQAIDDCFDRLSADGATLSDAEQDAWLLAINKQLGRGSEFRAARAAREARGGAPLTRADFQGVYAAEVTGGKFWGVEHDLRVMRGKGLRAPGQRPFTARFDALYCTSAALTPAAVLEALPPARMDALLSGADFLPNAWHASDHLPVGAALRWAD